MLEQFQFPPKTLRTAVQDHDAAETKRSVDALGRLEAGRAVQDLSPVQQTKLFQLLQPQPAADLIGELSEDQAAPILANLSAETAAAIVERLPSDEQADLIGRLSRHSAEQVLSAMTLKAHADARELLQYGKETAGGLMIKEYLSYPEHFTAEEVVSDMRRNRSKYRQYDVQYAYLVTREELLSGVLRLRDLLLADGDELVADKSIRSPLSVAVTESSDGLMSFFDRNRLAGVPVVDAVGKLVGVVRRQDVERAVRERGSRTMLKLAGIIGGEELRSAPWPRRCGQRLIWLGINLCLDMAAVSVIAAYEQTLAAVLALAVFLPIIYDMSGNAGVQAIAVSMRELTLGLIRPQDFWYVVRKELAVGLIGAVVLGLLVATVGYLWKGNGVLGLIVGVALGLNLIVAFCLGGTVPLVLKRLGYDPAMASGPVLTSITDLSGFFLALSLANIALPWLT